MEWEDEEVVMVAGVMFEDVCVCVCIWMCVCVCVRGCQWGPGALAVSEKTAGSIWGRLIGQLGTVSMWHAAVNLLSLFHCLPLSLSFTLILKCLRLYYYPICLFQYLFHFFFFPFNLFSLPHLPMVYFTFTTPPHPPINKPHQPQPASPPSHISPLTPCCSFVISNIHLTSFPLSLSSFNLTPPYTLRSSRYAIILMLQMNLSWTAYQHSRNNMHINIWWQCTSICAHIFHNGIWLSAWKYIVWSQNIYCI